MMDRITIDKDRTLVLMFACSYESVFTRILASISKVLDIHALFNESIMLNKERCFQ